MSVRSEDGAEWGVDGNGAEWGVELPSTPPGAAGPVRPGAHRRAHRRSVPSTLADSDGSGQEECDSPVPLVRQKSKLASGGARTVSSIVVWLLQCMGCAPGSRTLIGMAIYAIVLYACFLLAAHLSFATLSVILSHKVTDNPSLIVPCCGTQALYHAERDPRWLSTITPPSHHGKGAPITIPLPVAQILTVLLLGATGYLYYEYLAPEEVRAEIGPSPSYPVVKSYKVYSRSISNRREISNPPSSMPTL